MGNYFREGGDDPSEHARGVKAMNPPPFDVRSLTREEHETYDDMCKRSNKYGVAKINAIFVELIRLRLKLGVYQRGVT